MALAHSSEKDSRTAGSFQRAALAATFAAVLIHLAWVAGIGHSGLDFVVNDLVYNFALLAASATCLLRAWHSPRERGAWLAFGVGLGLWTAGDIYWTAALEHLAVVPYPSPADAGYLAGYPFLYAGIALLMKERIASFSANVWIDGAIGVLACAALGTALLGPALIGATNGSLAAVMTNLAYPLGDVLLLSLLLAALVLTGVRDDLRWITIGVGLLLWALADAIYLYQEATSSYLDGNLLDSLWPLGALGVAAAATLPEPSAAKRRHRHSVVFPSLFSLIAVGLLVADHFDRLPAISIWLAAATLAVMVVRLALSFRENDRLLRAVEVEADFDALTGLGNRRKLTRDLDRLIDRFKERRAEVLFALFDLDGFKAYNDAFGHPAGDVLLARLGQSLNEAMDPYGRAYRLGGDEFCIVASCDGVRHEQIVSTARRALSEEGHGFSIGASHGAVALPQETPSASEALRIADQRMYAEKGRRTSSAERQTRDILLSILQEREPDLSRHLRGVARLATAIGQDLELDAEELDVLSRAAEMHDVGKIAIPDDILHKSGPLDELEWKLVHSHTLIGERILSSAPAMAPVARLVRSSHERWDGAGYPDRLPADEIPLGSRIIFICDAYDAMLSDRPYRRHRSSAEALDELRRHAGTQFDPELVEVFCRHIEAGANNGDAPSAMVEPAQLLANTREPASGLEPEQP